MTQATVAELFRYPIKGLSPEKEPYLEVTARDGLPLDRRFALARGTTRFDPQNPEPLDKGFFLMLRKDDRLASLRTHFAAESGTLTIAQPEGPTVVARIEEPAGRATVESFFADFIGKACEGQPRLVEAPGHKFTDVSVVSPAMMRAVSVINLASVRDLEQRCGTPVHPLRFRANIYVDGLEPWAEFDWLGQDITIGTARFRCVRRTQRCAAVDVNPETAVRDTRLPKTLMTYYGHPDCGVYLEVLGDGTFSVGDTVACGSA